MIGMASTQAKLHLYRAISTSSPYDSLVELSRACLSEESRVLRDTLSDLLVTMVTHPVKFGDSEVLIDKNFLEMTLKTLRAQELVSEILKLNGDLKDFQKLGHGVLAEAVRAADNIVREIVEKLT